MLLNDYNPRSPSCSCYVDRAKDLPVQGGQTTLLCAWKRMWLECRNRVQIFRIRASYLQPITRLPFSCVQKKISALDCRDKDQMLAVFRLFGFRSAKLHFSSPLSCSNEAQIFRIQALFPYLATGVLFPSVCETELLCWAGEMKLGFQRFKLCFWSLTKDTPPPQWM